MPFLFLPQGNRQPDGHAPAVRLIGELLSRRHQNPFDAEPVLEPCSQAAIDRGSASVEPEDVQRAIDVLIRESQQTIIRKFDTATASPRRENFFFQVLLACALAETDGLGYFRAADVREPYSRIMGRRYEIPAFVRHLHDLANEKRGEVLQRLGELHNYRFRFADPMLQPYVLMHGLKKGLVGLGDIREN